MNFIIDYPENLVEPKGLHIPKLKDVQQAVDVTKMALRYIPNTLFDDEEDFDFIVKVDDTVFLFDRKLCECHDLGEGVMIHPSASGWTVVSILDVILYTLLGPPVDPHLKEEQTSGL